MSMIEQRLKTKRRPLPSDGGERGDSTRETAYGETGSNLKKRETSEEEMAVCLHSMPMFRERSWEELDVWLRALPGMGPDFDAATHHEFRPLEYIIQSQRQSILIQTGTQTPAEEQPPLVCIQGAANFLDEQKNKQTKPSADNTAEAERRLWLWVPCFVVFLALVSIVVYTGWRIMSRLLCPILNCQRHHQTMLRRAANAVASTIEDIIGGKALL